MSKVYSTRFFAAENPTVPLEYRVPAGYRAVLRSWTYMHEAEPTGGLLLLSLFGVCRILYIETQPNVGIRDTTDFRVVINEGEQIEMFAAQGNWDTTLSGYLLTLP